MSNTKREPLLSDEQMRDMVTCGLEYVDEIRMVGAVRVNSWHESARAKDAELIQMLIDDLRLLRIEFGNRVGQTTQIGIASLYAAEAAGFKPTDQ
jgi:hypothetical protein